MAVALKSVQAGTAQIVQGASVAVPIATVDPATSSLVFSCRVSSTLLNLTAIRGRIAGPDLIVFDRSASESSSVPVVIDWYVIEYEDGYRAQRFTVTLSSTSQDIDISPVDDLGKAYCAVTNTTPSSDTRSAALVRSMLTEPNRVNLAVNTAVGQECAVEVVEIEDAEVQVFTVTSGNSENLSISAVDLDHAWLYLEQRGADSLTHSFWRARFVSPTQVLAQRIATTAGEMVCSVIASPSHLVQHATVQMAAGTGTANQSIAAVDLARSYAHTSSRWRYGTVNSQSVDHGRAQVTVALTATDTVQLQRSSSIGDGEWEVFVITVRGSGEATLSQSGYRWRDDDGGESDASWLAPENTPIMTAVGRKVRLRIQVDAEGDPGSKSYALAYRKAGSEGPWNTVLPGEGM